MTYLPRRAKWRWELLIASCSQLPLATQEWLPSCAAGGHIRLPGAEKQSLVWPHQEVLRKETWDVRETAQEGSQNKR